LARTTERAVPKLRHTDWPDRLWIVRHGQSAGNVARDTAESSGLELIDLAVRDADVPLSALGVQQSEALARWFADKPTAERPNIFISSPFVRAQQTCLAVARATAFDEGDVLVDERLREKEFGILDRYTRHGIVARFPELSAQRKLVGKFYFRPPGGESWCDVILRLRSLMEVLRRDHVGDRVLIVGHQVIVNCFRYLLECMSESEVLAIDAKGDVPNCGVTEYAIDRGAADARFGLVQANLALPLTEAGAPVTTAPDQPAGPK
jgi:broad specificity phosphatase PhoE